MRVQQGGTCRADPTFARRRGTGATRCGNDDAGRRAGTVGVRWARLSTVVETCSVVPQGVRERHNCVEESAERGRECVSVLDKNTSTNFAPMGCQLTRLQGGRPEMHPFSAWHNNSIYDLAVTNCTTQHVQCGWLKV